MYVKIAKNRDETSIIACDFCSNTIELGDSIKTHFFKDGWTNDSLGDKKHRCPKCKEKK